MPTALRKQRDEARKQRTRQQLCDAAASVFVDRGYHCTLISDIVAEAGVGQGTFYRHFADKREIFERLFNTLVADLLGEFAGMSARLPGDVGEYRAASIDAIKRAAEVADHKRALLSLCLREGPSIDLAFADRISSVFEQLAALARFYLDHAIQEGFARPCRSDLAAEAVIGVALRLFDVWWRGKLPDTTLDEMITEVVDLAFHGFGLFPPPPRRERED